MLFTGPTPIQPADRLGAALGLEPGRLLIKRDDLTPFGGGNKVRKLRRLARAALDTGADTLITGGGAQSNHVRATAAVARHLGLDAVAVLTGRPPATASGNLVIDALVGARFVWTGATDLTDVEAAIEAETAALLAAGRHPFPIPVGGANPTGSGAYLEAVAEIQAQVPTVELVVTPAGSGGTHAGLAAGFGDHSRVLGVGVGAFTDIAARVTDLAVRTAQAAGVAIPTGEVRLDNRYGPAGYGAELDSTRDALRLAARTEGLILDPVYTGKALAALRAGLADGSVAPGTIVFLHCGGTYGLLSDRYADWAAGPF